jgi:hypothetical protein
MQHIHIVEKNILLKQGLLEKYLTLHFLCPDPYSKLIVCKPAIHYFDTSKFLLRICVNKSLSTVTKYDQALLPSFIIPD